MTWSAVGTWHGSNNANLSLSNQAAGNLLVVEVLNFSNSTVWATGLTGGGATWVQAGVKFSGTVNGFSAAVFLGTVTSTGAQTATPVWSGTAPGSFSLAGQEFHSTIGAWSFDKQGNLDSAGTSNWPSLTPGFGAGELYFGFAANQTSASAGSTSGYVYNASVDSVNNGAAYNVSCPGSATFPVWVDTEQALGIVILVAETVTIPAPPVPLPLLPPGWFPGSDRATASPGAVPFTPLPGTTDAAPAVVIPPTPEAAPYQMPPRPPGWFPGSAAVTQDPGGIPFYSEPPPADPSRAVLPPPAPDPTGEVQWLPWPPNYFPGSQAVAVDPGGIPFYSQPQPLTPPPAPLPLPVITGQAGTGLNAYFRDQNGNPRLYLGAETWGLPANAGRWNGGNWRGDYDFYHAVRFAQGFTANVTHPFGHTHTGCNNDLGHTWDGVFPFLVNGSAADLTGQGGTVTLNDPFWQRIDYMLSSAAGVGITVFLDMSMSNDMPNGAAHGFTNGVFQNASTAQIQTASQRVAERYAATQNLVWFFGDDYYNDDDTNYNAMWTGINAGDPRVASCTSIEYYPSGNTARYDLGDVPANETPHGWGNTHATYQFVYTYQQTYFGIEYAYKEPSPLGPVIWGDGMFWGNGGTSAQNDQLQRNATWWALASGARGVVSEDETVLQWGSTAAAVITTNGQFKSWTKNIYALFSSLPGWHRLIADTGNALVTAGRGTRAVYSGSQYLANTDNYVAASRTPDGSLAVIYCGLAMSITIDQTLMAPGYTATWADPASGALTGEATGSTYSSSGLGNNSAGGADWVLILQGTPVSAPPSQGLPDYQPLPPNWFPGSERVTYVPGGIPFDIPDATDQNAAQAGGAAANVTGVAAPVTVASPAGVAASGASITGTAAAVTVASPAGVPSGAAGTAGTAASVTVASPAGVLAAAANVTGTAALVTVASPAGAVASAANVTGVAALVTVSAPAGVAFGGTSGAANITGTAALVTVTSPAGVPSGSAGVTGIAAPVTAASPAGVLAASAGTTGTAAHVTTAAPAGVPAGSGNVTGVAALVTVTSPAGVAFGGTSGAANVTGIPAAVTAAAGAGTLSAGNAITGTAAHVTAAAAAGVAASPPSTVNATSAPAVTVGRTSAPAVTTKAGSGPAVTSKATSSPAVSDG